MKTKFKNNGIHVLATNFEEVLFDVGSEYISTQFNGLGGFTYFHLVNNREYTMTGTSHLDIFVNDVIIDIFGKKEVFSSGRMQTIKYKLPYGWVLIEQYPYKETIFNKVTYSFDEEKSLVLVYDFLKYVHMPYVKSDTNFEMNKENGATYVRSKGKKGKFFVCIDFINEKVPYLNRGKSYANICKNESKNLQLPVSCNNELYKSIYASSMFAALENFKISNNFAAFAAGVHYLAPLRTYFRDSYWTTLCLYKYDSLYLANQIEELALGIAEDGTCPSAVLSDFNGFWGGHVDSPCFFVMMVADYVNHTKDWSILDKKIKNETVGSLAFKVGNKIQTLADSSHLLYKAGPYNRLDWCDALNRTGYVTYDECLYYQCLLGLDFLSKGKGSYKKEAEIVKKAINEILWNEEKGYYNNFVDGNKVVDNLSIDTILAILFDIVPENKKELLLDNFENILYSKNHKDLKDFGVMCLYPVYQGVGTAVSVSVQPYNYHNGANWPYWAGLFAYMLKINGRDYDYALTSWYYFSISNGHLTPLEFLTPYHKQGSNLQAWSSTPAFALQDYENNFFKYNN